MKNKFIISVPEYLCKYTDFRRPGWKSDDYDLFWQTVRQASHHCRWHNSDKNCMEFGWFFLKQRINAHVIGLHNFLRAYEKHIRKEDLPLGKLLRNCNALKSNQSRRTCQRSRICPFCYCHRIVHPVFQKVMEAYESQQKAIHRVVSLRFLLPVDTPMPEAIEPLLKNLIAIKTRFTKTCFVKRIPNKWIHFSLQGYEEYGLQLCCNILLLATHDESERVEKHLAANTPREQYRYRDTKAAKQTIRAAVGAAFSYPAWFLRTPIERMEAYLQTPLYAMRTK